MSMVARTTQFEGQLENHCIIAVTLSQNNGITDLLKGKKQTATINHLRCFLAYDDQQIVLHLINKMRKILIA